jgi:sarcosine oxidase subunit beta
MSLPTTADVVIIGAGIVGCATAYAMARAGLRVVICDRGAVGGAVSGASLACLSAHMIDSDELALLTASCALWRDLEDELDSRFEYHRCGQLRFIARDEDAAAARAWFDVERQAGVSVELLDTAAVRQIAPKLEGDIVGATWSPTDATVNPFLACRALIAAACAHGATAHPHTTVTGIDTVSGCVSAVSTTAGTIATPWVVNAAGPWASRVAAMVGLAVPIVPRKAQCLATVAMPPTIPCVVGTAESSGGVESGYTQIQQAASGQILFNTVLGGGERVQGEQDVDLDVDYPFMIDSIRTLLCLFPSLEEVQLLRSWARYEAVTPDDLFILGPVQGVKGFLMAAGDGGTGFVRAPIIGRLLKELIVDTAPSLSLDRYALERFADAPQAA